ncbi:MAG: NAD(P)/FAD-dependent oxidoreductase [Gemmatimonadota bacterium]
MVGAGAAGLTAAIFSARAGAPTLLLERTRDGGRKILISGGGRCNVLPGTFRPGDYVTDSSPHTLRKILRSWPLAEQRRFFEEDLGIPLKHEDYGDKLFPVSDRARDVRDALVEAVRAAGGEIRFGVTGEGVELSEAPGFQGDRDLEARVEGEAARPAWRVRVEGGPPVDAGAVILATGGLSVAATGSDGRGLRWARDLGHRVHATYPALTPLLADPPVHAGLAGVSLEVELEGIREEDFLFTHRGYSGPAVLDVSHLATRSRLAGDEEGGVGGPETVGREEGGDPGASATLRVSWTGEGPEVWDERLREGSRAVSTVLAEGLPSRLAETLQAEAGVPPDRRLSQLRKEERRALVEHLSRYPLPWTGDEGYKKAEVTGGGVALDEVDARTLESRRWGGLYLCGEMLDAFGPIGGHNFLWAWATGRAAGTAAGSRES